MAFLGAYLLHLMGNTKSAQTNIETVLGAALLVGAAAMVLRYYLDGRAGYRRLGQAYLHSGRKDEALQAHLKAIELNPYYWLNYYALGQAYSHLGANEKALSAFYKVVELDPENAAGYDNLGITYFAEGKLNDSIPFFKKALELRPFPDTYSNLALSTSI